MKYTSPKYEVASIEANDVITSSVIQANNCTVITNQVTQQQL